MALRFALVALVVALGMEPPTSEQISTWSRAGQTWIAARLDDFKGATLVAPPTRPDTAFETIVDDMATTFVADLAQNSPPARKTSLVFEPIEVPDTVELSVAGQLDSLQEGEGLALEIAGPPESARNVEVVLVGPPAELAVVHNELVGPPAEFAGAATQVTAETSAQEDSGRSNRLISAVRLTRQAAVAWMSLIHESNASGVTR